MLKHLPHKNDIPFGQIVFYRVHDAKLDIRVCGLLPMPDDERLDNIASHIALAVRPDPRTDREVAASEIDGVQPVIQ